MNGHLSNAASVSGGVPQGSNLGPPLFSIYINDFSNCLSVASLKMFADDTNITVAADSLTELENKTNLDLENLNRRLARVYKVKSLGLLIDEHLTWKDHVDEVVKKVSNAVGVLKQVRPLISVKTAFQIYHALI